MVNIAHLLLAAGCSKRMGKPKQLLPWGDITLIEHQINTLLETGQDIVVVLGAYANEILPIIKKLPVSIYINNNWAEGMGRSIAYGTEMISNKFHDTNGVLISLIDQPLVTKFHFQKMISSFQPSNKLIIVSQSSSGWKGVPVLFDSCYFDLLKSLKQEEGAKKIIQKESRNVRFVNADNLLIDIDTPDVYHKMIQTLFNK